jgi:hypothetical protein
MELVELRAFKANASKTSKAAEHVQPVVQAKKPGNILSINPFSTFLIKSFLSRCRAIDT